MASKKLGSYTSVANIDTTLFTVATDKAVVFNLNVCNTTTTACTVRISIGGDAIEYDTPIGANGVLERTALIGQSTEVVSVRASINGVVFRAYGMEE